MHERLTHKAYNIGPISMGSEVVDFRVYYGDGEITMTESGVNLSGFLYFDTKLRKSL